MKLGIGIVTSGGYEYRIPTPFFWSMWKLHSLILRGQTPVTDLDIIRSHKFPTDVARNEICRKAIDGQVDWLLFLDCDHAFEPGIVTRLLEHDVAIVTARYHVRKPPYHPNLYVKTHECGDGEFKTVHYGHGLFRIDRCGAGALMVKRKVLERVGDPWFRYQPSPTPPHDLEVSEDFHFCERAQAEGFELWADWDAEVSHLVEGQVDGGWYRGYLDQMEAEIANGKPELADQLISCGGPTTLPSGQIIKPREYVDAAHG